MVCKEDVVSWFNELESYKRIETMCTLLNMCLPFELRFLGTCIEGLGRRDFQLLRGVSHSVNTAKELTAIYDSCLTGGPSDQRIRRKLALYVALLRFGKIDCVNDLFRVLAGWDFNDLLNVPSGVALEEILLLYTLAHWHPVFNFEQRQHCGNIVKRLTEERLSHNSMGQHAQGGLKNLSRPFTQMPVNTAEHIPLVVPAVPISNTNTSLLNTVPHHTQSVSNVQVGPEVSPITNISPVSNSSTISAISSVPVIQSTHLTNEALLPGGHLLQPVMTPRAEFTIPHGPWSRTTPPTVSALGSQSHAEPVLHNTQTASSPMLNQSDSPVHSRASSPNNNPSRTNNPRPQAIHINRMQRRPSNDPTPPPSVLIPSQAPLSASISAPTINPLPIPHVTASAIVTTPDTQTLITQTKDFIRLTKGDLTKAGLKHLRNFTLHEVSHMDEDKIGIPTGTMNELRTIVNCNGYCISNCTNPVQNHGPISVNRAKLSQPPPVTYCASQLQALRLDADSSLHQSSASESGSSGSAGHSPPDTPALGGVSSSNSNRTKERCRLNGRPEKSFTRPTLNDTTSSGPTTVGMTVTTPYYIPHHFTTTTRSMFGFTHSYRPPPIPFQPSPNGDIVYPFPPHPYLQPVPVYPPAGALPRSCYNCGGSGHSGVDCKELTMEEIARPGLYQLDYTTATGATPTQDLATDK